MKKTETNDSEIDLIALAKSVWLGRRAVLISTISFGLLGIIVALSSPVVFTASSTFIPQSSQAAASSGLTGVASLVGINLGGGSSSGNEIPPSIYPQIMESVSYKRQLLELDLKDSSLRPAVKLKDYMLKSSSSSDVLGIIKKYTIMLPFTILSAVKSVENKSESLYEPSLNMSVSEQEESLFNSLSNAMSLVNSKEGFVTLEVSMNNPVVSAIVTKGAQEILQSTVINYKIQRASELLAFNQKRLDLKKIEFNDLQTKLALFKDSNINIVDSRFENRLNGLEAEFKVVNSVYQVLSEQLEQSKLQVTRDTPVFSVIKPVTIPNQRSAPKRSQIVFTYVLLGIITGLGYVLTKGPVIKILKFIRS